MYNIIIKCLSASYKTFLEVYSFINVASLSYVYIFRCFYSTYVSVSKVYLYIQQVLGVALNSVLQSNNLFFWSECFGQFKVNVIVNLIVFWFTIFGVCLIFIISFLPSFYVKQLFVAFHFNSCIYSLLYISWHSFLVIAPGIIIFKFSQSI